MSFESASCLLVFCHQAEYFWLLSSFGALVSSIFPCMPKCGNMLGVFLGVLGASWEYHGNLLGTFWECIGNVVRREEIERKQIRNLIAISLFVANGVEKVSR